MTISAASGTARGVGTAGGDGRAWSPAMVEIRDPKTGQTMTVERDSAGVRDFWKFTNPGWQLVRELAKIPPLPALTAAEKEVARLNALSPAELVAELRADIAKLTARLDRLPIA